MKSPRRAQEGRIRKDIRGKSIGSIVLLQNKNTFFSQTRRAIIESKEN